MLCMMYDVVCDGVYDDMCDVCDDVCDVVCDVVWGVEGGGKVKWLILCCLGVLIPDGRTDEQTDIGDCRVAFATENNFGSKIFLKDLFPRYISFGFPQLPPPQNAFFRPIGSGLKS